MAPGLCLPIQIVSNQGPSKTEAMYRLTRKKQMKYVYETNCVNSTERAIREMIDSNIDITRKTFLQHVDRDSLVDVEMSLGYCQHPKQGMTMAGDWHISYHRSKYRGKPCYYFRHSAIEYIFVLSS